MAATFKLHLIIKVHSWLQFYNHSNLLKEQCLFRLNMV
jgi:hypothetical protein